MGSVVFGPVGHGRGLYVVGQGGHATVIKNAWASNGYVPPVLVSEDAPELAGNVSLIVGIGDNRARRRVMDKLDARGKDWFRVAHRTAHSGSECGDGSFLAAFAFVEPSAKVGQGCIINTKASVDHDCRVDDFAHVAPGATLCGRVHVCEGAFVGAGSTVVDCHKKHAHDGACGIRIGAWSLVRAGTIVQADVPDGATVGPGVWRG